MLAISVIALTRPIAWRLPTGGDDGRPTYPAGELLTVATTGTPLAADVVHARSAEHVAIQARTTKPVNVWAAVGALVLALEVFIVVSWLTSGQAHRTPTGVTPVPQWMKIVGHTWEGVISAGCVTFVLWFLVRPWRRERRVTIDGMFVIVFLLMIWQDPIANYVQPLVTYNTVFVNWGSWSTHVPGWLSPNGNLFAEPLLWSATGYVVVLYGGVLVGNAVMRRAKNRWPRLGNLGLITVCLSFFILLDFVMENAFMRLGFIAYPGAIRSLSAFAGHYYQFPIYESVFWGGTWGTLACARYFTNDLGQTVAERGIDRVRGSLLKREGLRLLAIMGLCNVIFMVGYNIPLNFFAIHGDSWPKDILKRSYLTDGLCGPSTSYACPGPDVPIDRPHSVHLGPAGQLVIPRGARLPGGQ